jgi:putative mycofactocin binding protein MftB
VPVTADVAFDISAPCKLSEAVSLRDEAFGALAYHHLTRRLVFLKSRELVALVRALGDYDRADDALHAMIDSSERVRYAKALAGLFSSEIICGR